MAWSLDPPQRPILEPDGRVRCPVCGATSFTPKSPPHLKWMWRFSSVVSTPMRHCNGCGTYLDPKPAQLDELTNSPQKQRKKKNRP
jgi:hypothetical protein